MDWDPMPVQPGRPGYVGPKRERLQQGREGQQDKSRVFEEIGFGGHRPTHVCVPRAAPPSLKLLSHANFSLGGPISPGSPATISSI